MTIPKLQFSAARLMWLWASIYNNHYNEIASLSHVTAVCKSFFDVWSRVQYYKLYLYILSFKYIRKEGTYDVQGLSIKDCCFSKAHVMLKNVLLRHVMCRKTGAFNFVGLNKNIHYLVQQNWMPVINWWIGLAMGPDFLLFDLLFWKLVNTFFQNLMWFRDLSCKNIISSPCNRANKTKSSYTELRSQWWQTLLNRH